MLGLDCIDLIVLLADEFRDVLSKAILIVPLLEGKVEMRWVVIKFGKDIWIIFENDHFDIENWD